MHPNVAKKLLALNHQFYQTFAQEFAATRQRMQPGVQRILEMIPADARILDLGCGNGELWRELAHRGHRAPYLGLDFSENLLEEARRNAPNPKMVTFLQRELSTPDWDVNILSQFDVALAFATLHHLPSTDLHRQTLRNVRALLASNFLPSNDSPLATPHSPPSHFIHANWQFLNSPRLRARIQPWEKVGLSAAAVGPNDYLLDWRRGGTGLRFVHHFTEDELRTLAAETGFTVVESFFSDGKEGNLGLYQVWELTGRTKIPPSSQK